MVVNVRKHKISKFSRHHVFKMKWVRLQNFHSFTTWAMKVMVMVDQKSTFTDRKVENFASFVQRYVSLIISILQIYICFIRTFIAGGKMDRKCYFFITLKINILTKLVKLIVFSTWANTSIKISISFLDRLLITLWCYTTLLLRLYREVRFTTYIHGWDLVLFVERPLSKMWPPNHSNSMFFGRLFPVVIVL